MRSSRPVVVHHPDEGMPGPETPDTVRRQGYLRDGRWADWIRNDAGDASGWHHHAGNETYVYVGRGSLTIHFGPGGADSVVARAGDFIHVPAGTIHRETTGKDSDLDAFVLRFGGEPEQVVVDGPEPSGG
jgi:uncharacterized RmlC-like cupin family protein